MLGAWRKCWICLTKPVGRCISCVCPCKGCRISEDLPEDTEIGDRETALRTLGMLARLVGGLGYIDEDLWGKYDPPLNAEGWEAIEQVCETKGSPNKIQAALYTNRKYPHVYIMAYRGTATLEGLKQDATLFTPLPGTPMWKAIREAVAFYRWCEQKYRVNDDTQFYVTGHSLGGYLAETVASRCDVEGASFNSPGVWMAGGINLVSTVAGHCRPNYEIHLTLDDPVSLLFPKPQNSSHIGHPYWHEGDNHRICSPYVLDQDDYKATMRPNSLPKPGDGVDQLDEIMNMFSSDSESENSESALCA
eukprot:TRINITY_DN48005_c0_g1_i1.p1 TRINITY_DN48005_c0_g1~~TRINITY_DN48005_c0_g1_i1.p1  ORF type:complete len:322 (+),score=28.40 TRINITY_DN48005_c0_g1_i1:54-968(+)